MEPYSAPPGNGWRLGPGPFIFSGVPPMCLGEVDLVNESAEKVRLRRIPVVGHKDEALARLGLGELRVLTPLAAQHRTRARAFFRVDPFTPPGTYRADLLCGEHHEPVVVHVWERRALRMDPGELRLRGAAGDVLTTVVVASNQGNVQETIRDVGLVFLEEHNWVGRSAVFALRDTSHTDGHQAYLDRLVRELKATLVRPVRIAVRAGASELEPGETREIELDVTLPHEMMKGRRYFGSTKFMSSKLIFKVECTAGEHSATGRAQ